MCNSHQLRARFEADSENECNVGMPMMKGSFLVSYWDFLRCETERAIQSSLLRVGSCVLLDSSSIGTLGVLPMATCVFL